MWRLCVWLCDPGYGWPPQETASGWEGLSGNERAAAVLYLSQVEATSREPEEDDRLFVLYQHCHGVPLLDNQLWVTLLLFLGIQLFSFWQLAQRIKWWEYRGRGVGGLWLNITMVAQRVAILVAVSGSEAPHRLCVGLHLRVRLAPLSWKWTWLQCSFPHSIYNLLLLNSKYSRTQGMPSLCSFTQPYSCFTLHSHTAASRNSAGMVCAPNMVGVWWPCDPEISLYAVLTVMWVAYCTGHEIPSSLNFAPTRCITGFISCAGWLGDRCASEMCVSFPIHMTVWEWDWCNREEKQTAHSQVWIL